MNEYYNNPINWIKMEQQAAQFWAEADRLIDRGLQDQQLDYRTIQSLQTRAQQMEIRARQAKKIIWRR